MTLATGSGISCPNGGSFYVCQGNATQFLGCCTEDPCADGSGNCADSNVRNTSYSSSLYNSIPQQACVGDDSIDHWYTCSKSNPPFMGCCLSNPCLNGGCFGDNLTAARLSDNTTNASVFETGTASTAASSASSGMNMTSLSTGAIVGIAIGSAMAALIVGVALFCLYKRHERKINGRFAGQGQTGSNGTPGICVPSPYQDSSGFPSPQYPPGGAMLGEKIPVSPGHQRPVSQATSWWSGRSSGQSHGRVVSDNPSVSSLGSVQGGMHGLYNQHAQQAPQGLSTVSEMDGVEVARPTWELDASSHPTSQSGGKGGAGGGHVYGSGYRHVRNQDD